MFKNIPKHIQIVTKLSNHFGLYRNIGTTQEKHHHSENQICSICRHIQSLHSQSNIYFETNEIIQLKFLVNSFKIKNLLDSNSDSEPVKCKQEWHSFSSLEEMDFQVQFHGLPSAHSNQDATARYKSLCNSRYARI